MPPPTTPPLDRATPLKLRQLVSVANTSPAPYCSVGMGRSPSTAASPAGRCVELIDVLDAPPSLQLPSSRSGGTCRPPLESGPAPAATLHLPIASEPGLLDLPDRRPRLAGMGYGRGSMPELCFPCPASLGEDSDEGEEADPLETPPLHLPRRQQRLGGLKHCHYSHLDVRTLGEDADDEREERDSRRVSSGTRRRNVSAASTGGGPETPSRSGRPRRLCRLPEDERLLLSSGTMTGSGSIAPDTLAVPPRPRTPPPLAVAPLRLSPSASTQSQLSAACVNPNLNGLRAVTAATQAYAPPSSVQRRVCKAAEQAAFPIRCVPAGGGPCGATRAASPATITPYTCRVKDIDDGVQLFDLWYQQTLDATNIAGKDAPQVVKLHVQVAASVTADATPDGRLVGILRIVSVSMSVDGQLSILDKASRARALGYYLDQLSVRAAAVPPLGMAVVLEVGGGIDAGTSVLKHETAVAQGLSTGVTIGIGGGGPLPSASATVEQNTSQTASVSAKTAAPAWEWRAAMRRRDTHGAEGVAGGASWSAPADPTYVEWTWSLTCWSTGLPYEAASTFCKDARVWPRMETTLAVPAQINGQDALCARLAVYGEDNAPWSAPSAASDGASSGVEAEALALPPVAACGATPHASAAPLVPPATGTVPDAGGSPAVPLASLLDAGLVPVAAASVPARAPSSARCSDSAPLRGLARRRRPGPQYVVWALELAPSLVLHRQGLHRYWPDGAVTSHRWPPRGSPPEVGVQRFLVRVRVTDGGGS